jgi:hypothetical protein
VRSRLRRSLQATDRDLRASATAIQPTLELFNAANPIADVFVFIVLLETATPTEEQVEAQESKMLALRNRIDNEKWCQLYSVEMEEGYLIYQNMRRR